MEHFILSRQINPFVRCADLRKMNLSVYEKPIYASDCRLFYFVKGNCKFYADNTLFDIKENDLVIIPPMTPYYCEYTSDNTYMYNINFDYLSINSGIEMAIPISFKIIKHTHQVVHITDFPFLDTPFKTNIKGIEPYLEKIAELYRKKPVYFRNELNAYFSLALSQVFKHILNEKTQTNISDVLDYIHTNYSNPLTNEEIGKKFGYHPNYLNKLFVTYTGVSLHKYVINHRIEKAQLYLNTTNLTITEIAEKTGWKSIAQFSKAFKKTTGISPGNFKII